MSFEIRHVLMQSHLAKMFGFYLTQQYVAVAYSCACIFIRRVQSKNDDNDVSDEGGGGGSEDWLSW